MDGVSPTVIGPTGYGNDNSSQALGTGLMAAAALKGNYYPTDNGLGYLNTAQMSGICDLRHEVAANREVVKDAESNIRHDIGDAECNIRHDVLKAESDIRREVAKEASDMKFQLHDNITVAERNLNNRFGLVDTALVRNEYETKLAAQLVIKELDAKIQHTTERLTDKIAHALEEVREDIDAVEDQLEECCCEAKVRGVEQTGLLNTIISALNVSSLK